MCSPMVLKMYFALFCPHGCGVTRRHCQTNSRLAQSADIREQLSWLTTVAGEFCNTATLTATLIVNTTAATA